MNVLMVCAWTSASWAIPQCNIIQSSVRVQENHSNVADVIKVLNDIIEALASKQYCLFLLTCPRVLIQCLINVGFSAHAVGWFVSYLSDRTQTTQFDSLTSGVLSM